MKTLTKLSRMKIWMGLIVIFAVARFFSPVFDSPLDHLFSDPARHWNNALKFRHPDLIAGGDPLGYQIYLVLVQFITSQNPLAVSISAGTLSVLMPWLYYKAGRELGLEREGALLAWALVSCMPSLFSIYHYFLIETLLLPLVGLALWMSGRAYRKQTVGSLLTATACWSLAIITKPTPAPIALALMFWIWWKTSRQWKQALICAAVGFLLFIPSCLRSWQVLGEPLPLGNLWIHSSLHRSDCKSIRIKYGALTYSFSSPSCYTVPLWPLNEWMIRRGYEDRVFQVDIRPEHEAEDFRMAARKVSSTGSGWLARWLENIVLLLYASSWPENTRSGFEFYAHATQRWLWMPLIFFVCWINFVDFRRKGIHLIGFSTTVLLTSLILQNSFTMEGRYRKPLEPILLLNFCVMFNARRFPLEEKSLRGK